MGQNNATVGGQHPTAPSTGSAERPGIGASRRRGPLVGPDTPVPATRTIRVNGEDIIVPANATDAQISKAMGMPPATARALPPEAADRTWTDSAIDALPTLGMMAGGTVGALGFSAFGTPIAGGLGAIEGGAFGAMTGEAAKQHLNRMRGKPSPTTPGEAAARLGKEGVIGAANETLGQGLTKVIAPAAVGVYRGYLKPSLAKNMVRKAGQVTKNSMAEGLAITEGGLRKAEGAIAAANKEAQRLVDQAKGTVDIKDIADRVRAWAKAKYFQPGKSMKDYQKALKVAAELDQHPALGVPPKGRVLSVDVPVGTANRIKTGIQDSIADADWGKQAGARATTQKIMARMLRHGVESETGGPGGAVARLNARQARLLDSAKAIRAAVNREANQSKLHGSKTLAAAAFGVAEAGRTGNPYFAALKAAALRVGLHPGVATRAAIVASRMGAKSGAAVADVTATVLAMYRDGLPDEPDDNHDPHGEMDEQR